MILGGRGEESLGIIFLSDRCWCEDRASLTSHFLSLPGSQEGCDKLGRTRLLVGTLVQPSPCL